MSRRELEEDFDVLPDGMESLKPNEANEGSTCPLGRVVITTLQRSIDLLQSRIGRDTTEICVKPFYDLDAILLQQDAGTARKQNPRSPKEICVERRQE